MFVLLRLFLVVAMLVSLSSVLSATYIYNKVVSIQAQEMPMQQPYVAPTNNYVAPTGTQQPYVAPTNSYVAPITGTTTNNNSTTQSTGTMNEATMQAGCVDMGGQWMGPGAVPQCKMPGQTTGTQNNTTPTGIVPTIAECTAKGMKLNAAGSACEAMGTQTTTQQSNLGDCGNSSSATFATQPCVQMRANQASGLPLSTNMPPANLNSNTAPTEAQINSCVAAGGTRISCSGTQTQIQTQQSTSKVQCPSLGNQMVSPADCAAATPVCGAGQSPSAGNPCRPVGMQQTQQQQPMLDQNQMKQPFMINQNQNDMQKTMLQGEAMQGTMTDAQKNQMMQQGKNQRQMPNQQQQPQQLSHEDFQQNFQDQIGQQSDEQNAQQLKMTQQGMRQMAAPLKKFMTQIASAEKKGITASDEMKQAAADLQAILDSVKNATSFEEIADISMEDIPPLMETLNEGSQKLGMAQQFVQIKKNIDLQVKRIQKELTSVLKKAGKAKLDSAALAKPANDAIAVITSAVADAEQNIKDGDIDAAFSMQQDLPDLFDDAWTQVRGIGYLVGVSQQIKSVTAQLSKAEKDLKRFATKKMDTTDAAVALNDAKSALSALQEAVKTKVDFGDLDEAVILDEALQTLDDAMGPLRGQKTQASEYGAFQATGGVVFKAPTALNDLLGQSATGTTTQFQPAQ